MGNSWAGTPRGDLIDRWASGQVGRHLVVASQEGTSWWPHRCALRGGLTGGHLVVASQVGTSWWPHRQAPRGGLTGGHLVVASQVGTSWWPYSHSLRGKRSPNVPSYNVEWF